MNFFSSPMDSFYFLIETICISIEVILNKVEETLSDIIETIGNIIQDFLDSTAEHITTVYIIGRPLIGFTRWISSVISAIFLVLSGMIKGVGSILTGITAGTLRIVGSLFVLNGPQMLVGFWDILTGAISAITLVGGHLIILIQCILLLQSHRRPLTTREKNILERIFKSSLGLYNIRLVEGWAGVFELDERPFTFGNTIYLKKYDVSEDPDLLVHECSHVWQFQNCGARYLGDAILVLTFMKNPYDWENELKRGKNRWVLFNRESQAQLLEDIFMKGRIEGRSKKSLGMFYDADNDKKVGRFGVKKRNYTELANDAVLTVRARLSTRLSRVIFD